MKKSMVSLASLCLLAVGSASLVASPIGGYGDGGAALQAVLDGITVVPAGNSSVDVTTDDLPDALDSNWAVGGSGGAVATLSIELTGFAGSNTFGIYDTAAPGSQVEVFGGGAGAGAIRLISILFDGSVLVNFSDTGIDFAGNSFGFYLGNSVGAHPTFYSNTGLNGDSVDHMVAFQGEGDKIQIPPFSAGIWGANEYVLAWEDTTGGGDRDYDDFVVLVESINPVPEPTSIAMFGLGLAAMARLRRRR